MKKRAFIITVVAAATAIFTASTAAAGTAAGNNKALIGVNPKDASLYSGKTFKCPGSNKVIPIEQVNDNYCDCPYVEGITVTDEPGTGACRNGVFYCTNHKFRAMTLPASRVNDGVCDCCDGSDEWLFPETGHCKDTCKEQGKKSYEADKARYAEMKKAVDSRKKLAAEATKELNEKSKALEELNKEYDAQKKVENELSVVERAKKEALDKKEDEVRKVREEREQREREEKERAEKEATEKKEKSEEIVDSTKVVVEPAPTLADEATFGMMGREEEEGDTNRNIVEQAEEEVPPPSPPEEEEKEKEHEEKKEEEKEDPELIRLRKEWDDAHDEYTKASNKAYETKRKIDEISEVLKYDFGDDKCFYSMYDKCVSVPNGEYTYEVCSYKKGAQKKGGSTSLGNWAHWKEGAGHTVMEYNDGQRCFNGKTRTLTVTLECGPEYKALGASEPAMCEYAMRVATPCACSPEELTAIEENIRNYEKA